MIRRWFPKLGVWARLLVGGVGLVTLCALSIAVLWIWHGWQVDAELDRLRAAGEPVTLVDLKRVYPPPPSELDAPPHWLSGFEAQKLAPSDPAYRALPLVGERGHGQIDALLPGQPWPEFVLAERYVDERSEVLRHFRAAAKVGGAVAKITAAAHVGRYVDEHDQVVNLDIKLELKPFVYASNVVRLAFLVELRRGRRAEHLCLPLAHVHRERLKLAGGIALEVESAKRPDRLVCQPFDLAFEISECACFDDHLLYRCHAVVGQLTVTHGFQYASL